ncbi:MAG TPA: hypothetical protein VNE18_10440 [Rhodanobacter sp.]|nr:hypothetical protein [Rhodanobacter sp.]
MCGSGGLLNPTVQVGKVFGDHSAVTDLANPVYTYGVAQPRDQAAQTAADAQSAEAAHQKQISDAMAGVDKLFNSPTRTQQYADYGKNTLSVLKDSLDQNEQNASRGLNFGLIRTGNLGGSEDITQHGLLQQDYSKGLLDASNKAQGAEAQLKGEDQAMKSQIDNLILNGMSATEAAQQASQGLSANLQGAQGTVAPATFDSVFGDLAHAYINNQANQGAAAGSPSVGSYFQTTPTPTQTPVTSIYDPNYLNFGGGQ